MVLLAESGDLRITKAEITSTAKFYKIVVGDVTVEVLALRAPDGTVRTAFNTCQICYTSGRGYYIQQGDVLVCQNCKSRFRASQVELIKGGCNPVPITAEEKTEDSSFIVIPKALLQKAAFLFAIKRR
jgi:uncharacterized membrane protein